MRAANRAAIAFACYALATGCEKKPARPVPEAPAKPAPAVVNLDGARAGAEFEREFDTETDPARRIEIINELAMSGAPDAVPALQRIYRSVPDLELQETVIRALQFSAMNDPAASLALLDAALAPPQPAELRMAAADTLGEIDLAAAIPIWKKLLEDPDPALREMAEAAIEYLAARNPPP